MEITSDDIHLLWGGFYISKINKLSDAQLLLIEQQLSLELDSVSFANVEEHRYLTVSWSHRNSTTDVEKIKIAKIINEAINQ